MQLPENAILLLEVLDHRFLVSVHPAGEEKEEELKGELDGHGGQHGTGGLRAGSPFATGFKRSSADFSHRTGTEMLSGHFARRITHVLRAYGRE